MDLIITILPVVTKDLPISPRSTPSDFLSRCKFSTLTTRQPMVEIYLLTFPRFPLRKKEHKSYFGKNRTHDFRTSRCAGYLLDHSGDECYAKQLGIHTQNRIHQRAKRVTNYERSESLIYDDENKLGIHTQNRIHKMGEAATPLRKPSQRHSTLRDMDAHHVLCALNPKASHLRATAASLAECTQLQQHHSELAADRVRDWARADAQRQDEHNRMRERLRSASRRQSAGGVGRVEHADGNRPATLEERGGGRAPQPGYRTSLTGKKPAGM